jgi:hypothetical protein
MVLAFLQQIKDQDRNLIMHPEVVLQPDEALTLFEVTKGAILMMAEKLPLRIKEDVFELEPVVKAEDNST